MQRLFSSSIFKYLSSLLSFSVVFILFFSVPSSIHAVDPIPATVLNGLREGGTNLVFGWYDSTNVQLGEFDDDLPRIKAAGGGHIRLSISMSVMEQGTTGKVNTTRWDRLKQFINLAKQNGIVTIINMHDTGQFEPGSDAWTENYMWGIANSSIKARHLSLMTDIAKRMYDENVDRNWAVIEPANEPIYNSGNSSVWYNYQPQLITALRSACPDCVLFAMSNEWQTLEATIRDVKPSQYSWWDARVIPAVHFYEPQPMVFCSYPGMANNCGGKTWPGTYNGTLYNKAKLASLLAPLWTWQQQYNIPVILFSEIGTTGDLADSARGPYLADLISIIRDHNGGWSCYEWDKNFGMYPNHPKTVEACLGTTALSVSPTTGVSPTSQQATPTKTPTKTPTPTQSLGSGCKISGCNSELCVPSNNTLSSTCDNKPEYACYKSATCAMQTTGQCGWTQTAALTACLQNPPTPTPTGNSVIPNPPSWFSDIPTELRNFLEQLYLTVNFFHLPSNLAYLLEGIGDTANPTPSGDQAKNTPTPTTQATTTTPTKTPTKTPTPIPTGTIGNSQLSNPNATAKTKTVYAYIKDLPNRTDNRVISGQFGAFGGGENANTSNAALTKIFNQTGKYPALTGMDYGAEFIINAGGSLTGANNYLTSFAQQGGIVTISWHAPSPWTTATNFGTFNGRPGGSLMDIITSGKTVNTRYMASLDKIAAGLQQLQNNGVVVLWRPFHEMNGNWFWWCGVSKEEYIALWRHMYNYFTTTKGLNNLIWVYSPNYERGDDTIVQTADYYYPGDAYVDMTSLDKYIPNNNVNENPLDLKGYESLVALGKPIGLLEFGALDPDFPDTSKKYDNAKMISSIKAKYPKITMFMYWESIWAIGEHLNSTGLVTDPWVITRDEVPRM